MRKVFLSIGSNIDPEKNIPACIERLRKNFKVSAISPVYETEPVGPAGDRPFWNLAAAILTEHDNERLRADLRKIEAELGRIRDPANRYAPRTIDMDILPQKDYREQAFIMIPLAKIAPHERDPETGQTYTALAARLGSQRLRVRILKGIAAD